MTGLARVSAVLAFLAFAGTADAANIWVDAFSDRWHGAVTTDPISGVRVFSVYVVTANVNGAAFGPDLARVGLVCRAGKARLSFDWTFKAAGSAGLSLEYRFEGFPGRSVKARYVNRSLEETTATADIRQFLADASAAQSLLVRVNSDTYGVSTATFRTKAGADMVTRFNAACPDTTPR